MIGRELFKSKIKHVCLLCGQSPSLEQLEAMYQEIKDRYTEEDFLRAVKDRRLIRGWSYKVHFAILQELLDEALSDRVETEAKIRKKQEEEEIKRLIKSEQIPEKVKKFLMQLNET